MSVTETDEQRKARESAERSAAKKEPRDKELPDGAKPGDSENLPGNKFAYDADAKAKEREDAPVTIGGREFRRVKKSWDVTRTLRRLLRVQERSSEKITRLEAQKEAKAEKIRGVRDIDTGGWETPPMFDEDEIAKLDAEVEALDDQVDKLSEESDQAAYDMIRLLLRDPAAPDGAEAKPDDEFLKQHLDASEAAELVRLLTSGAEPDPIAPTPSS